MQSLAPVHPYMVRTAVWAGMYILPTRASFMQQVRAACHVLGSRAALSASLPTLVAAR